MKIIFENSEGGVSIIVPTPKHLATLEGTDAEKMEQIAADSVPYGVDYEVVEDSVVPSDRTFRNAWKKDTTGMRVSLSASKEIAHDKRREARTKEFAPLDIKATIPAEAEEAETERAAIRTKYATMQTGIDNAANVEELKTLLPE